MFLVFVSLPVTVHEIARSHMTIHETVLQLYILLLGIQSNL
jgi:hypothetical protein